ncbi:MAG: SusC/RagA family TonB-linked outer membrane protein, partial [Bacteroidota bacterium]
LITSVGHQVEILAREGERSGNIYAQGPRIVESGPFAGERIVVPNGTEYALDEVNETLTGNIYPDFLGGLSTNFRYKNWNLGFFLDYSFGATLYNFKDYVLKGTGASVQSLFGRNEKYGGLAYYIDETTGENIPWEHDQAAPAGAEYGLVYHDGIIVDGVQEIIDDSDPDNPIVTYEENDRIVSANDYYTANYIFATGAEPLDGVTNRYDNDYIKIRELSLSYNFPSSVTKKLNMQRLSVALFARNIGFLYRTLPNFDAESADGTKAFVGNTVLPSPQSFGIQFTFGL